VTISVPAKALGAQEWQRHFKLRATRAGTESGMLGLL
jgi:hypothetical protein